MRIEKSLLESALSGFSGRYREVFLERTHGIQLRFLNGNLESPTSFVNEGMSFVSRTEKQEYFSSFSGLQNIAERAILFSESHQIASSEATMLTGPEYLDFGEHDVLADIISLTEIFENIKKLAGESSHFLRSYELSIICAHKQYIVGNSIGKFSKDAQYYNSIFISFVGSKENITEESFIKITGTDIVHDFSGEKIETLFRKGLNELEIILDATPAPSGVMDVVIGAEAGGTIIHEAVGHGLEADLQSSSVYRGKLGTLVAHPEVNIIDDPTRNNLRGYYSFDHEGNSARKTYLIKDGILVSYLHNNKTAELFGVESTGHGRRDGYSNSSIVRMGSTYLDSGKSTKESIIEKVTDGIYVAQMGGGQVNTITGDFVFKVGFGYRIREGKLAEVIRGANISGNGPEMLKNIQAIGNDLGYFDGGTCGKAGQHMPVSDATPTILVKLKVTGVA